MSWKDLYKQAVILDTETTGLSRGVGIHEVSLYNVAQREISQYLLAPNLTIVQPANKGQDFVQFSSRASDKHYPHPGLKQLGSDATWEDAIRAQILMEKGKESQEVLNLTISEIRGMSDEELREQFEKRMPKIRKWISEGRYPWLNDLAKKIANNPAEVVEKRWDEAKALKQARELGVEADKFNIYRTTAEKLLTDESNFSRKLGEGAIWIANTNFESKQIGAKLAALEESVREEVRIGNLSRKEAAEKLNKQSAIRSVIAETPRDISDIFMITGKEVNLARYRGYTTGDWRETYRAILKNTGKGDVRDILDIVRSQQSFLQKGGYLKGKAPSQLSMDVQGRLYGFSVAKTAEESFAHLTKSELHAAWADAADTENFVLRESLRQTDALDQVERRTAKGLKLIEQAKRGEGALYSAIRYAKAKEAFDPIFQKGAVRQNLARAALQLLEEDETYQSSGFRLSQNTRVSKSGLVEKVPYARPAQRLKFTDLEEVYKHLETRPDYQATDVKKVYNELKEEFVNKNFIKEADNSHIQENFDSYKKHLRSIIDGGNEYVEDHFNKVKQSIGTNVKQYIGEIEKGVEPSLRIAKAQALKTSDWKAMDVSKGKVLRYAGLFAGGVTLAGALFGQKHEVRQQRGGNEILRSMNYEKWLQTQQHFAGLEDPNASTSGFQEQGVGAAYRHQMTDFGSPYQGPVASDYIFQHQDLLSEREKYNRVAFGARHYDPESTIGTYMSSFGFGSNRNAFKDSYISHRVRYEVPSEGELIDTAGYEGLKKGNLLSLDLSKYKISVEDADTITLKKRGVVNSLSYFFGTGPAPMSIRMAGIDAPETAHGNRAAMPLAYKSTDALKAMLSGDGTNVELLIDQANMTYGRTVGFVFADGQNLNLELLRQGQVAYLPFHGGKKNYYNPAIFSRTEKLAQGSNKQMWGRGYYQAYRDIVASSGSTVTFNTLVNPEKVVKSSSLMSASALMKSAEDMGVYTPDMAQEAAEIGDRFRRSNFKDDYKSPILFNHRSMGGKPELEQLKFESGQLMKMREGPIRNKMSRKSGYGNLDKSLVLDSIGSTTSIFNKRRLSTYDTYGSERKQRMKEESAMMQRIQLKEMFQSPIGHYRM
jgi:endonuclease YncB( thermonuclease family)